MIYRQTAKTNPATATNRDSVGTAMTTVRNLNLGPGEVETSGSVIEMDDACNNIHHCRLPQGFVSDINQDGPEESGLWMGASSERIVIKPDVPRDLTTKRLEAMRLLITSK